MTLRRKILISAGLVFVSLIAILYFVTQSLLMHSFTNLEEKSAQDNVERAVNALNNDLQSLATVTSDWAAWDDTYAFIENANQDFAESNLGDSTFTTLRLNLVLFINSSGEIVYSKAFDLANKQETAVPQALPGYLNPGGLLATRLDPQSITRGIILLPEEPLLFASHPILTSDGKGPVRGTLILGRYLDDSEIGRLAEQT